MSLPADYPTEEGTTSSVRIRTELVADFPTDEDVEVAATAVYALDWGNHPAHMNDAVLNKAREQARAALLAVAEARRTEEADDE